jgi:hypothetical protein
MMALLIALALCCDPEPSDTKAQTPEDVEVLEKWEKATAGAKKLEVVFDQFQYNEVFRTERRGKGTLTYTAPDRATLRIEPGELKGGAAKQGWTLEPVSAHEFEWTPDEFREITSDSRVDRTRLPLPADEFVLLRGLIETPGGPLRPFLAGFDADRIQSQYKIQIAPRYGRGISFEFTPVNARQLAIMRKVNCLLDAETFRPRAIRIQEPGDGAYTIYWFREIKRTDAN